MIPTTELVLRALRAARLPLEDEKATQCGIAVALENGGIGAVREFPIAGGIIDFAVHVLTAETIGSALGRGIPARDLPFLGIEVKIKGGKRDIFRQLCGYCEDERLIELIVATSLPLQLPPEINGKPVAVLDLGKAWL